jgi:tetratricopeptide (TPR) repeat protein
MTETPPRVFISYSHDSAEHQDRVLELADWLRADGIDAMIDQYVQSPPEGWPGWCREQIDRAAFVLMVCTEVYLRRVDHKEEPGIGHGVLWEGRLIYQYLYNSGSVSGKFVPVLFAEGRFEHVPVPVQGGTIYRVDTEEGYEGLLRLLTDQPLTPMAALGQRRSLPPRPRRVTASPTEPAKPLASLPHPRVEDLFVGRSAEREQLAAALFPPSGTRRPVVVSGMAGVGKSYLVDRFFCEHGAQFPGGYLRLALDPDKPTSATDLLSILRDRLKLPAGDDGALSARLLAPLTLVHIENADTVGAGQVAGDFAASLPGCAVTFSARLRGLGADAGWREVVLSPFDTTTALDQLRAELGAAAPGQDSWPSLAEALGRLPLALHLAAGHFRAGHRAEAFLRRLRTKNLAMTGADPADPTFRQRSRALLSDTFELSLDALRREGGADGERWLAAFSALGHAPAIGFGGSLGTAISGLDAEAFEEMAFSATRLSLLDRVLRGVVGAYRLHPLLADLVRTRTDKDVVRGRMTDWFVARLPEGGEDQGRRWREIGEELAAMTEWLLQVPPAERLRVGRAGMHYAAINGPFHAWVRFCEETLTGELDDADRSSILWILTQVALWGGLADRALEAAKERRELDRKRGAERDEAMSVGFIADILQAKGEFDDALKIRNEEELPVYNRLGDAGLRALAMGKIADILQARGQLDEALKIRNEEQLPVYERLGDVRSRAVTMGKIAAILQARGQLDEALKIHTDEELPVYERLGDVHARAVTMAWIANIQRARGDRDGAARALREEVLPVHERLGDAHSLLRGRWQLAGILLERAGEGDRDEARLLLQLALDAARRLKLPEAQQIEEIMRQVGLKVPSLEPDF